MIKDFIIGLRTNRHKTQTAFVKEYGQKVYAFILSIVANPQDAEELTVDVFVQAMKAINQYDEHKSSISTWILRIAHNMAISHLRHKIHDRVPIDYMDESKELNTEDSDNEEIGFLNQAISRLPPEDQEVLHLYYYEGMRLSEIADTLGLSEGTLTVRLHRIRKKLKTLIENEYGR